MIDLKTVDQMKQAPIEERLQIIELILQSLKEDIGQESKTHENPFELFRVRKFSLGQEIHVNREELYSERD